MVQNRKGAGLTNSDPGSMFMNKQKGQIVNSDPGSTLTNQNAAELLNTDAGSLLSNQNQAILNNLPGSMVSDRNGGILVNSTGAQINNLGTLSILTGSFFINDSAVYNKNRVIIDVTSVLSGNGIYTQFGNTQVDGLMTQSLTDLNAGVLHGAGTVGGRLQNEATIAGDGQGGITLTGDVLGKGDYKGKVTFQGSFSPGDAPALIQMQDVVFAATNQLQIEIGGRMRGTEYDALDGNSFNLGGALDVSLIDLGLGLLTPRLGDFFDLIDANEFSGDFTEFDLPTLMDALVWQHTIESEAGGLNAYRLQVVAGSNEVPEPSGLFLLLTGLIPLVVLGFRRPTI
jgi:hypothetical protein